VDDAVSPGRIIFGICESVGGIVAEVIDTPVVVDGEELGGGRVVVRVGVPVVLVGGTFFTVSVFFDVLFLSLSGFSFFF